MSDQEPKPEAAKEESPQTATETKAESSEGAKTEVTAIADTTAEPKESEQPKTAEVVAEQTPEEKEEEEEEEEEEPDDGVPKVLVTGASGFIATHIVKQLQTQGRFRVRGSVRSKKNQAKVKPLLDLVPEAKYALRLVEADLTKADSWAKAVKGCSYVFHVASPFTLNMKEEEIVKTAVDGTINVLKACSEAGTVKRVVLTSSQAAVSSGNIGHPDKPQDYVYTEKDWSVEEVCPPYEKSKLKAEQAAWEFVKGLDENKRFELVCVNPCYVLGPLLSESSGDVSQNMCVNCLTNKMLPNLTMCVVDVHDVAAGHIAALEKPEAAGNRYLLYCRTMNTREFAEIVRNEFKSQGYKTPTKNIPKVGVWFGKFFNPAAKSLYPSLGKSVTLSNDRMVNELGIQPRPIEQCIIDSCYRLIELGIVKKTPGYLGHPSTRPPPPVETAVDKPVTEGDKPTEGEKPAEGEKPVEGDKPAQGDKPAEEDKPAEGEKSVKEDKPAEPVAEGDKPAVEEKPAEGDKPAEDEKPAKEDEPAAESPAAE